MRKKAEVEASAESLAEDAASVTAATRCSQTWAMLSKRVYEVDPLCCPECGGQRKVVSFIEPPQVDVIEAILNGHQSGTLSAACGRRVRLSAHAHLELAAFAGRLAGNKIPISRVPESCRMAGGSSFELK